MSIDRNKMDEIFGGLDKDSTVGILVQQSPDPDCLGAASGFAILLKQAYGLGSKIYHFGEISHPQNKSMKNILHIALQDGNDFDADNVSATVVLDTDLESTGFKSDKLTKVDVRIDHHTMDRDEEPTLNDIRAVGATCSIIWDYLNEYEVDMDDHSEIATALILGIKTDTLDFTSANASDLDMEAYRALLPYVNKEALAKVTKFPLPKEVFELEALAYKNRSERNTILVSFVGELGAHSRDVISTIADRFARMAGINTVVIMAIIEKHLQASIRSDDARVDVSDLCVKVFGKKYAGSKPEGGAGGARLPLDQSFQYINNKEVKDKIVEEIISTFENKVFEVLGEEEKE
ncbi:MAG: DHH family phosphoesterase [Promethearchaeota archaeon]|jgi:nanoRNase/pAp phosphatase (c-di-AMP/oligoRNAs hydrolase)